MKKLLLFLVIGICQFHFLVVCGQELPEQYREDFVKSVKYRLEQFHEVDQYANKLLEVQNTKALNCFQPDFSSIEDYEKSLQPFRQMIMDFYSYPPPLSKDGEITKIIDVSEDKYCYIKRVWIEVIEGVNAYGILMVPKNIPNKAPLYSMEPAKKEAEKAKQFYKKLGIEEKFEFVPHNGGHVYYPDDVFNFLEKYLLKK